jgi:AcrR family transcriptional regulator
MPIDDTLAQPKRTRPKDRREQILREAFRLISDRGFNAVSLADIAAAAGIQKSSVLHHFPSMKELLLEVLQVQGLRDYEFYREPTIDPAAGPAEAREVFSRYFERDLTRPEYVRLQTILAAESLAPDHPAHAFFDGIMRSKRTAMADSLAWKPNPQLAAGEFIAFWDGLETAWRGDADFDVRAVWESFCDRFFV